MTLRKVKGSRGDGEEESMNSGSAPAFGRFHGAAHVREPHFLQDYFWKACQVSKCTWEKAENVFWVRRRGGRSRCLVRDTSPVP